MILTLTMLRPICLLCMTQSATSLQLKAVEETPGMLYVDLSRRAVRKVPLPVRLRSSSCSNLNEELPIKHLREIDN